jgi:3-deoxy-D-manno-octulosonate 8-phosphate phosphatase (KDO 8-P phosphatase)
MARVTPSSIPPEFWPGVRLFAMDVDGILTDGTVAVASDGTETKFFSVLDGLGLRRVLVAGFAVAWISGRESGATTVRANELKITRLVQGCNDKLSALKAIAEELRLSPGQCLYMGDDDIDVAAMKWAGLGITVPGATPAALCAAGCVTERPGGRGAVREVCDLLLARPGP